MTHQRLVFDRNATANSVICRYSSMQLLVVDIYLYYDFSFAYSVDCFLSGSEENRSSGKIQENKKNQ